MYTKWLQKLEDFKEASKEATFIQEGLTLRPADGAKGTIEIVDIDSQNPKAKRIYISKAQAIFIIDSLKKIFEL